MRIRTRLFLIALCVLVPALLISGLGSMAIYGELRQAHRQLPQETARTLARLFDQDTAGRRQVLEILADSPQSDSDDLEPFYRQAAALAGRTGSVIEIDDESGANLFNSSRGPGAALPADLYGFRVPLPHGTAHALISDVYYSPSSHNFVYALRIPVMRDGRPRYSLTMITPADSAREMVSTLDLPASWVATILDRNEGILARSAAAAALVGKRLSQDDSRRPVGAEADLAQAAEQDPQTAVFQQRSSLTGYRFLVSVPVAVLDHDAVQAGLYAGAVLLALLTLGTLGAVYLARHTLAPLEALRAMADQLGRGEPVQPRASGILELDQVASVMARTSLELRSGKAELERQASVVLAHGENVRDAQQQKQKLEAMGRLTNAIAHDFNNVLQTMTSALQMAHSSAVTTRSRMLLETCERAVRRGGDLSRQLMAFGELQEAEPETVDLGARIHAMNRLLRGALPAGIDLRIMIADDLWPVTLDATQFELTLLNLTINARDAMAQDSALCVKVYNETLLYDIGELKAGDFILVTLDGSTEGASRQSLTDAIELSDGARGAGTSADMGFPQAYGFARQCGGTLLLHEASQGTKFTLYLPRAKELPQMAAPEAHPDKVLASLLFVEDDLLVREVVSPALREAGFDVVDAVDGDSALAMLESGRHFDLVFSDIMMPGQLNGIGLAQHVVRDYPATRVILTTGYSHEQVTVPGIQVLGKPYAIGEVVTVLNAELADMHPA